MSAAHDHVHHHGHAHSHAAPRHAVAGPVTWSLLRLSAGTRLGLALGLVIPVWAAILWVAP